MTRHILVTIAMFTLACGGSDPGSTSAAGADGTSGGSDSGGSAAAGAAGGDSNEATFKVNKSDSSGRPGGVEGSKIEATLDMAAVRFIVVDRDKGPIRGIVVALTSPEGQKFYTKETDAEGFAEVLVPKGKKYALEYLSLGRKNVTAKVPVPDKPNQNIKLTLRYKRWNPPPRPEPKPGVPPRPEPKSERFVLKGVEFDTGKSTIRDKSFDQLDTVVEYMTHKESARLEVSGHTDNVGKPAKNKALSQSRAQACMDYLVAKGIDPGRIEAVGYGDEQPIASNETKDGRQQNRRIEATEL